VDADRAAALPVFVAHFIREKGPAADAFMAAAIATLVKSRSRRCSSPSWHEKRRAAFALEALDQAPALAHRRAAVQHQTGAPDGHQGIMQ
jgi:hypothetical protein